MKCVLEKEHIFKNGTLDEDAYIKHSQENPALYTHDDDIHKIIEECKSVKGANECDTTFKIAKCLHGHRTLSVQ